jgi:hypothetical protein
MIVSMNELIRLFEPNSLSLNYIDLSSNLFVSKSEFTSLLKNIDIKVNSEVEQIVLETDDLELFKLKDQIEELVKSVDPANKHSPEENQRVASDASL